jgi:enoyl-[acyl-carrier protein] reductase II
VKQLFLKTPICELLGIEYPIIQGGMVFLSTAELVAAVSNAGGLGVLTSNHQPDWVREQIRLTRRLTDKLFGINVTLISPFVKEIMEIVLEERIPIVTTGGGDPSVYVPELKAAGLKVMPVVSSVAHATRLEKLGIDAVVAEGMESGAHIGELTTMALVPQVVDSVKIPVVAAGGIADGRGLVAALALGAQAVQMGTRFICAEECGAHPKFKQRLLDSDNRTTVVVRLSKGRPMRCLRNEKAEEFLAAERSGASKEGYPFEEIYLGMVEGEVNGGLMMAGQSVGLIKETKTAKEIIDQIMAEAEAIIGSFGQYETHGGLP